MIYSLPLIILTAPLFISSFVMPFLMDGSNGAEMSPLFSILMVVFAGTFCLIIPISIAVAIIVPAAELHAVEKNEFSAGFRVREWWQIFRANTGGFLAAFGIYYIASMILVFAIQILMVTIILACLLPFVIPALTMYLTLIMYVTIAQAYRDAKMKLSQAESMPLIEKA